MGLLMSFIEQQYAKVDKISALHSGVEQQYYGMKICYISVIMRKYKIVAQFSDQNLKYISTTVLAYSEISAIVQNKLGLSQAKLSSAGAEISLVFICWGYKEKYSGCLG